MRLRDGAWSACAVGLVLTLLAAVCSELLGCYYKEPARSPGTFFMLDRSSVWINVTTTDEQIFLSGISLYQDGWNRTGPMHAGLVSRTWWPRVQHLPIGSGHLVSLQLPLWLLAVAFGLPVAWQWRGRNRPAWACKGCGYDPRGTGGSVCPECGAALGQVG